MKFILHSSLKNIHKEVLVGLAQAFVVLPSGLRFKPIISVRDDEIPNFKNLSI